MFDPVVRFLGGVVDELFRRPGRPKLSPRRPRHARPSLEGLEGRWCPANFYWYGTPFSTGWMTASNWKDDNGQMWMRPPSGLDNVYFDGAKSNSYCGYSATLVGNTGLCNSLTIRNNYNGGVTLSTNSTSYALIIYDDLILNGDNLSNLDLGAGNRLTVIDQFHWTKGRLDYNDDNALATIAAGSILFDGSSDMYMSANVTTTNADSASTVNLGAATTVLYLDKGAVLSNNAGTLTHSRGTIDDTNHADHEESYVANASGATWLKDTTGTTKVSMTFWNTGTFYVQNGTYEIDDRSVDIANPAAGYGYYQSGTGSLTKIAAGKTLKCSFQASTDILINGGDFYTVGGAGAAYVDGDIYFHTAGGIYCNQDSGGGSPYGTLWVTGNLILAGGVVFKCDINGAAASYSDLLYVGKLITFRNDLAGNDSFVDFTVHGVLGAGRQWDVIQAEEKSGGLFNLSRPEGDDAFLEGLKVPRWETQNSREHWRITS